ncbi:MAG: hydrogen gas-evolving membrane-bound hydrogenase subunit E [Candidatus Bipolaricaulota bacterium]
MRHRRIGLSIYATILVCCFCGLVIALFSYQEPARELGAIYLSRAPSETGAANIVSAIYLNYRLYDTLFEILIFSVAVLGVRFYLSDYREKETVEKIPESQIVRTSADLFFPPIFLIGIYLVLSGHISPGGGFSGGVVAGTALLLCAVALGANTVGKRFYEPTLRWLEWGVLLVVLSLPLLPIVVGRLPFTELLPSGTMGKVISAGSIPIYNLLIGIKVFIGTWVIIHYFMRHRGEV